MDLSRCHRPPLITFLAAAACLAIAACTSTSISSTAPTSQKCTVSAAASPTQFGASGGSGALTINAARECTWTAVPQANWVSLAGGNSGSGDAVLPYTIAANSVASPRNATVAINGSSVSLSQLAAACTFSINPSSGSVGASGGPLTFEVNTVSGCTWSASADSPWLTVSSGASGSASATVSLRVAMNTGAARAGAVMVGGQTYRVSQSAAPAVPSPTPSPAPGPSPVPTPQPVPQTVSIDGKIDSVSGRCPAVSFTLAGYSVTATSSTTYSQGKCSDLTNGDTLHVDGTLIGSNTVTATDIAITKNAH